MYFSLSLSNSSSCENPDCFDQYIDEIITVITGGNPYFYLYDLRFSMYAMVDDLANIVERARYEGYGKQELMDDSFSLIGSPLVDQPYSYTGQRLDMESGLQYYRARYFDNDMGRFISRDPIGYVDGLNLYRGYFINTGLDASGKIDLNLPDGTVIHIPDPVIPPFPPIEMPDPIIPNNDITIQEPISNQPSIPWLETTEPPVGSFPGKPKCEVVIFRSHGYRPGGTSHPLGGGGDALVDALHSISGSGSGHWNQVGVMGCYTTQSMSYIPSNFTINNFPSTNISIAAGDTIPVANLTNSTTDLTYSQLYMAQVSAGRSAAQQMANSPRCKCWCKKITFKVINSEPMPATNNSDLARNVFTAANFPNATFGSMSTVDKPLMTEVFPCKK